MTKVSIEDESPVDGNCMITFAVCAFHVEKQGVGTVPPKDIELLQILDPLQLCSLDDFGKLLSSDVPWFGIAGDNTGLVHVFFGQDGGCESLDTDLGSVTVFSNSTARSFAIFNCLLTTVGVILVILLTCKTTLIALENSPSLIQEGIGFRSGHFRNL